MLYNERYARMKDLNTLQCIEKEKYVFAYDNLHFYYNEYKIILYVRCSYIVINIYKRNVHNNHIKLSLNIDNNELDYIYRKLSYELKCKDKGYELNLIKRCAYILD